MTLFQAGTLPIPAQESPSALATGWDEASKLLFNDSYRTFDTLKPSSPEDKRAIDFGRATTLINVQPKTAGNVAKADQLLQQIVTDNPSDEIGITAYYLLARIAHIHMAPPDEALAVKRYTDLINAHPQHALAQAALVKRALLRMFTLNEEPSFESRYQLAVKEAPLVTEPGARRDYMMLLVHCSVRLKKPASTTLDHLLQAESCGNFRQRALADLTVQIAEFASLAGKKDVAAAYYEKFLSNFQRDNRRYLIKEKLAALRPKDATR